MAHKSDSFNRLANVRLEGALLYVTVWTVSDTRDDAGNNGFVAKVVSRLGNAFGNKNGVFGDPGKALKIELLTDSDLETLSSKIVYPCPP